MEPRRRKKSKTREGETEVLKTETWEKSVPNFNGVEGVPSLHVVVKRYLMNTKSSLTLKLRFGDQRLWILIDEPAISFASVLYDGFTRPRPSIARTLLTWCSADLI